MKRKQETFKVLLRCYNKDINACLISVFQNSKKNVVGIM